MIFRRIIQLALTALVMADAYGAGPTKAVGTRWPSCLGTICFGPKLPDASQTLRKFGTFTLNNSEEDQSFCYRHADRFFLLTSHSDEKPYISSIYLSSLPICHGKITTRRKLGDVMTPEGLSVGDPEARVLEIYGEPNVVEVGADTLHWKDAMKRAVEVASESVFVYGPTTAESLFQASIHIKGGRVSGIELSNTE